MKIARILVSVTLSMLAACAWWMAGRPGLEKLDELTFSHLLHNENDVECESCHEGVDSAADTSQSFLPAEAACMECHEREDNCEMCHSNAEKRKARVAHVSELGFSHQAHLERAGEEGCLKCHPQAESAETLPMQRPTMDSCLSCHNHKEDYAEARCLHCHPSLRQKPLEAIAEFDHGGDWMGRHGMMARSQGASCLQCHPQSLCSECHSRNPAATNVALYPEAVERNLLHRGDWLSIHPIEARADGDTCLRCHQGSGFCESCHRASGIAPGPGGKRVPHPAGYAARGGESFHGDDARLRIETCVACHDRGAASNCVTCHKVGGIGGKPHPAGWEGRYSPADRAGNPVCKACHLEG